MKKVLLMGPSESGKTSMRSMIFANFLPRDTSCLALTMEMERSNVKFLGNLLLNLWDCGGQIGFIDDYLQKQRSVIFSNVAVLVYVFDLGALSKEKSEREWDKEKAFEYFQNCMEALSQFSSNAQVFCLLHKTDVLDETLRDDIIAKQRADIMALVPKQQLKFFYTSIWNDSLLNAWNSMVGALIPELHFLNASLGEIAIACDVHQLALFDKNTFLCICQYHADGVDPNVAKISNIVKRFRLSAENAETRDSFNSFEMVGKGFVAVLEEFTKNTVILAISRDTRGTTPVILRSNLQKASLLFFQFLETSEKLAETRKMLS